MATSYTFEDLSGPTPTVSDNPYDGLIEACHDNAAEIQARYETHRSNRGAQQKEKLSSPDFTGVTVDTILARLEDQTIEPGFADPRNCLVFWARPPPHVKSVIAEVQKRLKAVAPKLWVMPQDSLHMTALEITHSLTAPEIDELVEQVRPGIPSITDYTYSHRARVVKPSISYDAQAFALSFLPAAGESCAADFSRKPEDDDYTYHHLRRDLYALTSATGIKVASRYVVPSAHLTIGRFITTSDTETANGKVDQARMQEIVKTVDDINEWLKSEFWPVQGKDIKAGGEWIIGEGKGLDSRKGPLWYGSGGETIRLGKGF
ncbi:hypothetical protein E4T42_01040 [Aureobasidium subglaciale]|uniref:RNA ligase/cyclic nucleotide phosphodiesterase n=1 Tax=Aureobasidium subglaciale (strain EXF-2481) TaxID=1043005 RepID=A0A074ZMX1_AURSE|nr:uncharacterized protein AUEXF2481DRAFT_25606 [Aureobasidium subglaciale EXF-2481]KAI5204652.1 hypothetical protein E4T38_04617 [Aureobasidium subglaciale]KAI5223792.1 hypothetical protein E4T40_04393 [Aureobasidium subglaciale]KAI5227136.1 hypothetical protein E4T41_04480 [Aureobasidium subglaciale]KAI5257397.1 hypothetical protein E4T42_01040 [Aureobasidium subglaciale]KAI5262537.1 hypothetical protein E4T46_04366 [Aureobasidium subglaciale]